MLLMVFIINLTGVALFFLFENLNHGTVYEYIGKIQYWKNKLFRIIQYLNSVQEDIDFAELAAYFDTNIKLVVEDINDSIVYWDYLTEKEIVWERDVLEMDCEIALNVFGTQTIETNCVILDIKEYIENIDSDLTKLNRYLLKRIHNR